MFRPFWGDHKVLPTPIHFCIQFRIILKSMRSQCHEQRKSLAVQLNPWPMRRTELYMKIRTFNNYRYFDAYKLIKIFISRTNPPTFISIWRRSSDFWIVQAILRGLFWYPHFLQQTICAVWKLSLYLSYPLVHWNDSRTIMISLINV